MTSEGVENEDTLGGGTPDVPVEDSGDLIGILEQAEGAVADVRAPAQTPQDSLTDPLPEAVDTPQPIGIPAELPESVVPETPTEEPVEKALDDGIY